METAERYRLVVVGSSQVGKTAILHRYLHNTFTGRYKETVEDIHSREFRIGGSVLGLDILDTNFAYPDMRRLSIDSAAAFLVVLAVDSVLSFKHASEVLDEITERKKDISRIPIVVAGNKCDSPDKKIYPTTAQAWLSRVASKCKKSSIPYLETSAKTSENIVEIFKSLLDQSGFPNAQMNEKSEEGNNSPYLLAAETRMKRARSFRTRSPRRAPDLSAPSSSPSSSPKTDRKSREVKKDKGFTRHGSLIRRTQRLSLKLKQTAPEEPDESDCRIS